MNHSGWLHESLNTARDRGDWGKRHAQGWFDPRSKHEWSMGRMIKGWLAYADEHREMYNSGIGEDYVLGPEWEAIGRALLGLLNGETGRYDCGTLDCLIRGSLEGEGFNEE